MRTLGFPALCCEGVSWLHVGSFLHPCQLALSQNSCTNASRTSRHWQLEPGRHCHTVPRTGRAGHG
jgi:hypothetical protein